MDKVLKRLGILTKGNVLPHMPHLYASIYLLNSKLNVGMGKKGDLSYFALVPDSLL